MGPFGGGGPSRAAAPRRRGPAGPAPAQSRQACQPGSEPMTADEPPPAGRLDLPAYPRPAGIHPPLANAAYRSTLLRAPKKRPTQLPQGLTEITGPLLGAERTTAADAD